MSYQVVKLLYAAHDSAFVVSNIVLHKSLILHFALGHFVLLTLSQS